MDRAELESYREQLNRIARRVQQDAQAVEALTRMPTGGQSDGNLSNAPIHLAD